MRAVPQEGDGCAGDATCTGETTATAAVLGDAAGGVMDDQFAGSDSGAWLQNPVVTFAEILVTAAWPTWRWPFDALWWIRGR